MKKPILISLILGGLLAGVGLFTSNPALVGAGVSTITGALKENAQEAPEVTQGGTPQVKLTKEGTARVKSQATQGATPEISQAPSPQTPNHG